MQRTAGEKSQETTYYIKLPPIFTPNVKNILNMISNTCSIIPRKDISYKPLKNKEIKFMISIDSYRKLVFKTKYFDRREISYHTYQVRKEWAYRVVIKGPYHTTHIKVVLIPQGHDIRNVCNVRSRVTKEPIAMFYVDLDPKINNKGIYEIRYINNAIVTVEPPKKVNDIVQYHRCQQF